MKAMKLCEDKLIRKIVIRKHDNRAVIYLPRDFVNEFAPSYFVIIEKKDGGELVIKKL